METGPQSATVIERLRERISVTDEASFEAVINGFPLSTLSRIADRVESGSKLEQALYCDIFGVNEFTYDADGKASVKSLRSLNCTALTSDLIDSVPWYGWDAVRASLTDALHAISEQTIELDEFGVHRLRSAVLINIVKDRSFDHPDYNRFVDYFELHYDAIYGSLTTLTAAHDELAELNLVMVENIVEGAAPVLVEGTL